MHDTLGRWNALTYAEARAAVLPCNGSVAWSARLTDGRPYPTPAALYEASDVAWKTLSESDREQAYATHPRIGEHHAHAATATSLAWSTHEQSTAQSTGVYDADRLAAANRAYEARFKRTFLICATGKSKAEILAALDLRLQRTDEQERAEAAEQQRQITRLRLRRWLEES